MPVKPRDFFAAVRQQLAKFLKAENGFSTSPTHANHDAMLHLGARVVLVKDHFEIAFLSRHLALLSRAGSSRQARGRQLLEDPDA